MQGLSRFIFFVAMVILTIVSMWTTYVSLRDSILPEPSISIPLPLPDAVWKCSIFALLLSVAIGLMLFGLKMAIIDEQKRLNALGIVGLTVVGFISISFNMDVLYRTADRDFFIRYSTNRMMQVYEDYLAEAQSVLGNKRDGLRKQVAKQEAELESEIEGIRKAPAGYGPIARQEEYQLKLLQSENTVSLESLDAALQEKQQADQLLAQAFPQTLAEVDQLQTDLRVKARNVGAAAGLILPPPVKLDSPIFAVFAKLADWRNIGMKEIFFMLIAFFLDLGDIIGYSMVPGARKGKARKSTMLYPIEPAPSRAEYVPSWDAIEHAPAAPERRSPGEEDFFGEVTLSNLSGPARTEEASGPPHRGFRIRPR
ncbi:MAG: hypothetical protein HYV26_14885 [Candidatus Hydrogenedentes bacterium]|nr:hypothetical protein [Candidatus Hydrogenedentota bacterium]